jgi:hypothetical protein
MKERQSPGDIVNKQWRRESEAANNVIKAVQEIGAYRDALRKGIERLGLTYEGDLPRERQHAEEAVMAVLDNVKSGKTTGQENIERAIVDAISKPLSRYPDESGIAHEFRIASSGYTQGEITLRLNDKGRGQLVRALTPVIEAVAAKNPKQTEAALKDLWAQHDQKGMKEHEELHRAWHRQLDNQLPKVEALLEQGRKAISEYRKITQHKPAINPEVVRRSQRDGSSVQAR